MEVLFKKATRGDVEGIITLCNLCFQEDTNIEEAKQKFIETEQDPNQIYLVGIVDGVIIAHVKLTVVPTMYKDMNTYAIINHFCVRGDYRRHHIATQLLEEINKISLEQNCTSLKLWSNNVRNAAHACYYKNGFILNDAGFFSKEI